MEISKEQFEEWMVGKGLSDITRRDYLYYFGKFPIGELNQQIVNTFIEKKYHNLIARAFIKNLIQYTLEHKQELNLSPIEIENIRDIRLSKITGRTKKKMPPILTYEEIIKLAENMEDSDIKEAEKGRIMLYLTYFCGLRKGELSKIKPDNFNWELFDKNQNEMGELTVYGKGNNEGIAIVPYWLMGRVRNYINKFCIELIEPNLPIFELKTEHRWNDMLNKAAKKTFKDGRKVYPHLLRHSIGTNLYKKNADINYIKEFLRHKSIISTQIYINLDKTDLKNKYREVMGL